MNSWRRSADGTVHSPGALHAFTAAASDVLNPVLVRVALLCARVGRGMEVVREHRLAATCRPQVEMFFFAVSSAPHEALAEGALVESNSDKDARTVTGSTISATIFLANKSDVPLRIESVKTKLIHRNNGFPDEVIVFGDARRILSPAKDAQFDMDFHIPAGTLDTDFERQAIIHCCDLSGLSKYSLIISDRDKRVRQAVGFQPM